MTIKEAKEKNYEAYYNWTASGKPEAFEEMNDSNRDVIRAYLKEKPNTVGYKFYDSSIVDLKTDPLYNFCCDYLIDKELAEQIKNMKLTQAIAMLNEKNSYCLIWS